MIVFTFSGFTCSHAFRSGALMFPLKFRNAGMVEGTGLGCALVKLLDFVRG